LASWRNKLNHTHNSHSDNTHQNGSPKIKTLKICNTLELKFAIQTTMSTTTIALLLQQLTLMGRK